MRESSEERPSVWDSVCFTMKLKCMLCSIALVAGEGRMWGSSCVFTELMLLLKKK